MTSGDPSMALLAASAGDTVKLFDVSAYSNDLGDPCTLSYTPSPGYQVNSVKWNHTSESLRFIFSPLNHPLSVFVFEFLGS